MGDNDELDKLKDEIRVLRKTVKNLTKTIDDLRTKVSSREMKTTSYQIFPNSENCLEYDASWQRLVSLLEGTGLGLSAAEAARMWGKSRSRTSEVLNKLVDQGHLMKYRDGRQIKFRAVDG